VGTGRGAWGVGRLARRRRWMGRSTRMRGMVVGGIVQGLKRAVALYARCPHLKIEIWGTRICGVG
jgi:hypothetical protein